MVEQELKDRPPWVWVVAGVAIVVIACAMIWGYSKDSHGATVAAWVNNGAQIALALLLFWYVLETRRVANETRRLVGQSEAQLALLRREGRLRLAPFVLPEVLPLIRTDDSTKTAAQYVRERAGRMAAYVEAHGLEAAGKLLAVRVNPRQIRLGLVGDRLAQQIAVVLHHDGVGFQVAPKAVDLLSSSSREREIELPAAWKDRSDVAEILKSEYGSQYPLAVMPMAGTYIAVLLRDEGGTLVVFLRTFEPTDGDITGHGACVRHVEGT